MDILVVAAARRLRALINLGFVHPHHKEYTFSVLRWLRIWSLWLLQWERLFGRGDWL